MARILFYRIVLFQNIPQVVLLYAFDFNLLTILDHSNKLGPLSVRRWESFLIRAFSFPTGRQAVRALQEDLLGQNREVRPRAYEARSQCSSGGEAQLPRGRQGGEAAAAAATAAAVGEDEDEGQAEEIGVHAEVP